MTSACRKSELSSPAHISAVQSRAEAEETIVISVSEDPFFSSGVFLLGCLRRTQTEENLLT